MGSQNTAAGLLLLVLGVYLLLAFLTGQLEWLFRLGAQVSAARAGTTPTGGTGSLTPTGGAKPAPAPNPAS